MSVIGRNLERVTITADETSKSRDFENICAFYSESV